MLPCAKNLSFQMEREIGVKTATTGLHGCQGYELFAKCCPWILLSFLKL